FRKRQCAWHQSCLRGLRKEHSRTGHVASLNVDHAQDMEAESSLALNPAVRSRRDRNDNERRLRLGSTDDGRTWGGRRSAVHSDLAHCALTLIGRPCVGTRLPAGSLPSGLQCSFVLRLRVWYRGGWSDSLHTPATPLRVWSRAVIVLRHLTWFVRPCNLACGMRHQEIHA